MRMSSAFRTALLALTAFAGTTLSSASHADSGTVQLVIYKAGWVIGGSGGGGTLNFHGRTYGLSAGGLDYGLVFGGSKTVLRGRVSNISRPSDVAGVYGAAAPASPSAAAVSCANCTKESAHEHTGSAEAIRPSLRDGVTAYFMLSSVTGFFATVARSSSCCSRTWRQHRGARTTRLRRPRHARSSFARPRVHRISPQRS